jgi:ribosomal protein S10
MTQLHVIIKSFQWYQIKNTILFIRKIQFLLNYQNNDPLVVNGACKLNKISSTSFPKKRKLFTVLRSPHIDKKSREQFQFVFYKLKLILNEKNDNKTNLFIFLLKNSEFPGVEMEIILDYHSCLRYLQT